MFKKHLLLLLLLALVVPWAAMAQDLADYTFSTGTDNTQWITLSSSATELIASGQDDKASSLTNIGFTSAFPFGDGTYTKFWANSNGIFSFNSTTTTSYDNQFSQGNLSSNLPKICGITKDMSTGNNGYVKYELTGTAPNRIMVCEFYLNGNGYSTSTSATIKWQVQLYEADSKVAIVYGEASSNPSGFQIGLAQSTTDLWTINPTTHEASHATAGVSTTYGTWPGANRYYAFTRPTICCPKPTNLACTASTGTPATATFTWTNGGDETQWLLEYSTASDFTGASSVTISQSQLVNGEYTLTTGLTAEQTYYARIRAICPTCDPNYSEWSNTINFKPSNEVCAEIGTGATASSSGGYGGIYTYLNYYAYTQQLYTATELIAAGATEGVMQSIALRFVETTACDLTFEVYLGQTTATSLSSAWISDADLTKVYDGTTTFSGNAEWNEISTTSITDWEWDGTSNILVAIRRTDKTAPAVSFPDFYYTSATGMCRYTSNSSSNIELNSSNVPSASNVSGTTTANRPDMKFCTGLNPYPKPKDLTVSNLSNEGATISWTAPKENVTGYKYQYKPDGGTWSDLTPTTALSAPLSGLTANTNYTFQVQAIYAEGESTFATTTFTTLCNAFPIPYSFGFEEEEIADLNCWTIIDAPGHTQVDDGTIFSDGTAHSGDYFFVFSFYDYPDTNPQYMTLISPELSGITNGVHVEFYYRTDGLDSYPETFRVGYSTTDNNLSSFTWAKTITDAVAASYQLFRANYPAGAKYIAVQHLSDDEDYLILDDFSFAEAPSCVEPSNLQVSNITTTGAALSWTIGGQATAWDIFVTDDNTIVPTDETTPTYPGVTSNTNYPISGLTSGTTYYVYVRSACDATTHSDWTMPTQFNTACEAIPLPYQYDFEDAVLPVCWNTINPSSWNMIEISSTAPQHGSKHLYMVTRYVSNYGGVQHVVLPEVNGSYSLTDYQVTFYAKLYSGSGRTLAVGVMTDPDDASTFVQVGEAITPTSEYVQYKVRLNTYTGTGRYIAIKHAGSQDGSTCVDNLEVIPLPACLEPSDPVVSNITAHTAKVDWTGTSAAYNIDYRTVAGNDGSMLNEDFNSLTTANSIPTGWDNSEGTTTTASYKWCYTTSTSGNGACNGTSYDGSKCVRFNSYMNGSGLTNFLKTPTMNFPAGKTMQLTFWWKNPTGGDFSVYISTDGGTTTTHLKEGMTGQSTWKQETINLTDYIGASNVTIHFKGTSNYGSGDAYIYLDDVVIGENVPEGEWQHATSATNTKTLESLLASRKYEVKVQGNCGDQGTSEWSGIVSFTTDIPCPAPSTLTYNNVKSNRVDLSWTNGGSEDWIVAYKAGTDEDFTEVNVAMADVTIEGNTVTYTLTGLSETTPYTVKVADNCEASYAGDGTSAYTSTVSFTTLEACAQPTAVTASNIGHYTADVTWTGDSEYFIVQYRTAAGINPVLSEDFEDETHYNNNWTVVNYSTANASRIGREASAAHNGSYGFRFSSWSNDSSYEEYLINKNAITGLTNGVIEFYYRKSNTSAESFKVGYSSTDNDPTSFTFGENHEATQTWQLFHEAIPAGTKFVAIQYTTTACNYYLYVDDIIIGNATAAGGWQTVSPNPTTTTANLSGLTAGQEYEVTVTPSCDATLVSETMFFTTESENVKYFITEGNWNVAGSWEPEGVPTIAQDVKLFENATIPSGCVAEAKSISGTGTTAGSYTLTIEDGGQLKHNSSGVRATVKKNITGYGAANTNTNNGYYFISNPLSSTITTTSTPNISSTGLLTGTYDLYNWSIGSGVDYLEWRNYEANAFSLSNGLYGYLYANENDVELNFTGTVRASNGNVSRSANYNTTYGFGAWTLVGNPYVCDAYLVSAATNGTALPYYKMNEAGNGYTAVTGGAAIPPVTGVFYQATASASVYMVRQAPGRSGGQLNMNLFSRNEQLDNAILVFGQEQQLDKFSFREGSSKVYMPVEGKDLAIATAESNVGEMPVNFKAETNGSYTLGFNTEEVSFSYLHLIDNMTGADVDLLATPSYSFEARTTDYASRFKLVFATGNNADGNFAFFSNGSFVINNEGNATLQVIDVTGRVIKSESINGCANVSVNAATGVYMLRLINGNDVKVQKVIVK